MISRKFSLAAIAFFVCVQTVRSEHIFANPILIDKSGSCESQNIDQTRFTPEFGNAEKRAICIGLGEIIDRVENTKWSNELIGELVAVWDTFLNHDVFFSRFPPNTETDFLALAHSFPPGKSRDRFSAAIYLKNGVESQSSFYSLLFHELRHVYDFNESWKSGVKLPRIELERRAFLLMSLMDQETPINRRFSIAPTLWQDNWINLEKSLLENTREKAIADYLNLYINNKHLLAN